MSVKSLKKKILIISHDKIGDNMAGPGIRYHYMAEILSKSFDVTVGFFDPTYLPKKSFKCSYTVKHVDKGEFRDSFINTDAVIAMWLSEEMMEYCRQNSVYIVFDAYAPVPVENLALFMLGGDPITTDTDYYYRQSYNLYEKFFQYGDLFLFSNRRQLDFWVGYVFGSGSISVSSYIKRPVVDRFIYAPMGIDTKTKLQQTKSVIRNTIKGISDTDKVLLWTGGIWNWFDATTLIQAMKRLEKNHSNIKLVFFGTKHPNPDVPAMQEASDAIQLAKDLGLLNKSVFIHEGWVPYNERINFLLESDAAVNTTKDTIEAEFAHRTRVLDHILTSLPTIATSGDYLSDDIIEQKGIGITVPPHDEKALEKAIVSILDPDENKTMRENISIIKQSYDWTKTLGSLHDELLNNMTKLPFVEVKKPREMPKNKLSYKMAKKLLPRPIKSFIVKALRYGR